MDMYMHTNGVTVSQAFFLDILTLKNKTMLSWKFGKLIAQCSSVICLNCGNVTRQAFNICVKHNIGALVNNHCCHWKALSITYSECVLSVGFKVHALYYIVISQLYFPTLSHEWCSVKKKTLLNVKCAFWFSLQVLSETSLILRRISEMSQMCKCLRVKYPLFS